MDLSEMLCSGTLWWLLMKCFKCLQGPVTQLRKKSDCRKQFFAIFSQFSENSQLFLDLTRFSNRAIVSSQCHNLILVTDSTSTSFRSIKTFFVWLVPLIGFLTFTKVVQLIKRMWNGINALFSISDPFSELWTITGLITGYNEVKCKWFP